MLGTFLSVQGRQLKELVSISYRLSASRVGVKEVRCMKLEQFAHGPTLSTILLEETITFD